MRIGQAILVAWDSIKDNLPLELKISLFAAIPHNSKQFYSILDLSFHLRLQQGDILPSVNATTMTTAPKGAIDQLGHSLTCIIQAFTETEEDAHSFMSRWDINDGFWQMDAEDGAKWKLIVCPAPVSRPTHIPCGAHSAWAPSHPTNSQKYVIVNQAYDDLPGWDENNNAFQYLLEVYVDDFVSLVIPASCNQL